MEKICIVKRRKAHFEGAGETLEGSPPALDRPAAGHVVSIALTPEQAETVRSNGCLRDLCQGEPSQIVFNLHLMGDQMPRLVRPRDVCEMLQVSRHTVSKLVRTGAIKSYKIGRLRRFLGQDIIEYLSQSVVVAAPRRLRVEDLPRPETQRPPLPT